MLKNLLEQISSLYEQELYSNVVSFAELAITLIDQTTAYNSNLVFQLYVYYGDSLFNLEKYARAEGIYNQALQIRKNVMKSKSSEGEVKGDVDIKYKIHTCYVKLKQKQKAIHVLQSIAARFRTPKVNMALANLYRDTAMDRSATTCYKEVLRECPLALEAAENLLKLGVKGAEVNSLIISKNCNISWINTWLRGQAEMQSREYRSAIETFRSMDVPGLLMDNSKLLVAIGQCYFYLGEDSNALSFLQKAYRRNPKLENGKDLLAALLLKENNLDDLDKLVKMDMQQQDLWTVEDWITLGWCVFSKKKYDRALYFGHQACLMNPRNVEALLLKASTLNHIKKFLEASVHYRECLQISPYRYDVHKGLVECYIGMNKLREAITVASTACKQLNQTPNVLTMYASVLIKDPVTMGKAKNLLERALSQDQRYTPAVYILAQLLEQEQNYEEAIDLLKRHLLLESSSRLHQLLADLYVRVQNDEAAFDHYTCALNLDPNNQRAIEGLNNIGRANTGYSNYCMSVGGEPPASDHDLEVESDVEQWPNIDTIMM